MPFRGAEDTVDTSYLLTKEEAHTVYVNQAGDKMEGDQDMDGHKLKNAVLDNCVVTSRPGEDTDVVNKGYADRHRSHFTFGENALQMQKPIDMNSNKITEVPDPVSANDIVNKKYVDTLQSRHSSYFTFAQNKLEMRKNIDMNSKKITELADPVDPGDAVNMKSLNSMIAKLPIPFRVTRRNLNYPSATITLSDIQLPVLQNINQVYVTATLQVNKIATMIVEKTIKGTRDTPNTLDIKFTLNTLPADPRTGSSLVGHEVLGNITIEGIVVVTNEVTEVGTVTVTEVTAFRSNDPLEQPASVLSPEVRRQLE